MKRLVFLVFLAFILAFTVFPPAATALSRPPSWTVAQETMASGETWYAFAKAEVRQYKAIEVGSRVFLTDAGGRVFQAEVVEIVSFLAGSDPRNPTRIWIKFKSENQTQSDLAVIFKKWGPF
jgi:hypothetical protein